MLKKIIALMLTLMMAASLITVPQAFAEELTGMVIYVAPNGNDANDGSINSPLATLQGARDKIREIKKTGYPEKGITVAFREGEYFWTDTVEFEAEDGGTVNGPIVFRSYPGEKAIFNAGIKIPGSEFTSVTNEDILMRWSSSKAKDDIRQLDIKSYMEKHKDNVELSDYYPMMYDFITGYCTYQNTPDEQKEGKKAIIRRPLYSFDGEPSLWLARYPNKSGGYYPEENPRTQFLQIGEVVEAGERDYAAERTVFKYNERRISKYAGYEDVYANGFFYWVFHNDEVKVSIDAENQTITTAQSFQRPIKTGRDYFLYNILDELDSPGEYYVDKNTGIMYVYPMSDISNKNLNVSLFDKNWMIDMKPNCSNVTFSGIAIENTKGSGIRTAGSNIRIEYCDFTNIGGEAICLGNRDGLPYCMTGTLTWGQFNPEEVGGENVWQGQYNFFMSKDDIANRANNSSIYGCKVYNVGTQAFNINSGGSYYSDTDANIVVAENEIKYTGRYKLTYSGGIVLGAVHGITVENNLIAHCTAAGINGYVSKAVFKNNEMYDCMSESYDNGVFYLNYNTPNLDIQFIDNYLHHTPYEYGEITSQNSAFSQRSAIAFDNAYSGGVQYINNIFAFIPKGIMLHNNEVVKNNVFVECFQPVVMNESITSGIVSIPAYDKINEASAIEWGNTSYGAAWIALPIFDPGEVGEKFRAEWKEKYPTVMEWVELLQKEDYPTIGFNEIRNLLIVNSSIPKIAGSPNIAETTMYEGASRSAVENVVYSDQTNMFVDYENRNYTLTPEASAAYGNTLDTTKTGPQLDKIGTEYFVAANIPLPTVSGGVTAPITQSVPEKVKDAVVLTTKAPNALVKGTAAKVDSQNDQVMPRIVDSRTLVPARFISESFGGEVGWNADTRTVTITIDGKTVELTIDDVNLKINGEVATVMDVPAQIIENRTMVPLRVLCETVLGKKVFWDNKGLIVISDVDNILDSTADSAVIDEIMAMLTK